MNIVSDSKTIFVGTPSFLYCFYSTVLCNVKKKENYACLISFLESGKLEPNKCRNCSQELKTLRTEFEKYPVSLVVWDMTDRSVLPPWKDNISSHITSLANYFVTADGQDFFDLMIDIFNDAFMSGSFVCIDQ